MDRHTAFSLLRKTAARWSDHHAPTLGASLAFYSLLSLAPVILLVVGMIGLFLPHTTAEQSVISQASQLAGSSAADTLRSVLNSSKHSSGGIMASVIAVITLLFGASGVFAELRQSLDRIWDAPLQTAGVKQFVLQRLATFAMVLILGFLLLLSLLVSTAIGFVLHYFVQILPAGTAALTEAVNFFGSLAAVSILFALIFKFVPNVGIAWKDVGVGAVFTAVLFTLGRALLAFYLATAGVGSTYGAAGSIVALVVWVYYSAQIFFFGAVFTRVYADSCGSKKPKSMTAAIK